MDPRVALTQIPYTGFDFGLFGNALYWIALAAFAAASSYLVLYHRGGASSVAAGVLRRKHSGAHSRVRLTPALFARSTPAWRAPAESISEKAQEELLDQYDDTAPFVHSSSDAPKDVMTLTPSKSGEAPRIIVTRG